MNQAALGEHALQSSSFNEAVEHFTNAIAQNSNAPAYYISRSTAYTRVSPPNYARALSDAEIALVLAVKRAKRELIAKAQLRRAIALFQLERWADSKQCLEWVKKIDEKNKSIAIWEMKINSKLESHEAGDDERWKASVKEIPDVEVPDTTGNVKALKSEERKDGPRTESTNSRATTSTSATAAAAPQTQVVQTPISKIRHEWYQTADNVVITLFCKGIPKDKTSVSIESTSLSMSFPLPSGSDYDFSIDPLFSTVSSNSADSSYKIMSTKVEFTLKKAKSGQKWATLEGTRSTNDLGEKPDETTSSNDTVKSAILASRPADAAPAYPTSSRTGPKNWDKVASSLTKKKKPTSSNAPSDSTEKEEEEDDTLLNPEDDDEADPVNGFFKTLYKGADDDTRRAMVKSYQESNGTALSTNWREVGKGKVETTPPDGMEARKWGQ